MKKKLLKSEVDKILECINSEYKNKTYLSSEFKNNLYKEFNITESILHDIMTNTYQPYTEVVSKEDEIFKPIPNYEEYMISNYGTVLAKSGKELVSFKKRNYNRVKLCLNGIVNKYSIHRLVALTFIPNPLQLPEVNHIDGNPSNNQVSNLEWCTRKQNMEHATKVLDNMKWSELRRTKFSKSMKGKPHKKKLSDNQITNVIEETKQLHDIMGKWGFTPKLQAIADKYGVHKATIRQIMVNDKKSLT